MALVRGIALDGVPDAPPAKPNHYGYVDIDRHRALSRHVGCQLRTLLDGEDVTEQCVAAHDLEGWVELRLEHGVRVRRTGEVRFDPAPLPNMYWGGEVRHQPQPPARQPSRGHWATAMMTTGDFSGMSDPHGGGHWAMTSDPPVCHHCGGSDHEASGRPCLMCTMAVPGQLDQNGFPVFVHRTTGAIVPWLMNCGFST